MRWCMLLGACAACLAMAASVAGASATAEPSPGPARSRPWMDARLTPDRRADLVLDRMSLDEQITLLHGYFPIMMRPMPEGVQRSAGYVPGLPRLGIPALRESDASLGVANAGRENDDAAALPSGLAMASTFSPELAFQGGAMIGKEARQKGFNVLLAGGVNLARDPRNGRNFEYLGEDPLLAGTLDGAAIRGIQSQHVISTAKHYAVNDQETGRIILNASLSEAALRESDLLAFELALETGDPGAVMCAYDRVGGVYACQNRELLTTVLRQDWGWKGWTMSDWGAVHSLSAATAGLDQESAATLDGQLFDAPLKAAVKDGQIPASRVRQMAHRILRSMFAAGLMDIPFKPGGLDTSADAKVSQRAAEQGIVLLKNDGGLLPLAASAHRIALIGAHADVGVLSGGGSSQVIPEGSVRFPPPKGAPAWGAGVIFHPSSPVKAIQARAGGAETVFNDGADPAAAAALARSADVAIVFATQWASEGVDLSLSLSGGQDGLIEAVAAANPHTIVVLETGGPVLMPWLDQVPAVLEAWYPGSKGGEAIAKVLYGEVDPSGRLPITFPVDAAQLPRPELPGARDATPEGTSGPSSQKPFDVDYVEGSDVGYRWFARTGKKPLFPFGFGLSYTSFEYSGLHVSGGRTLTVGFTVANTGSRPGIDTPQLYLSHGPHRGQQRLIGWSRVKLAPGGRKRVTLTVERRMLADWDQRRHGWRLDGGAYHVVVGHDATSPALDGFAVVQAASIAP